MKPTQSVRSTSARRRPGRGASVVLASILLLAGCSGDGRPSVDDLTSGITDQFEGTDTDPGVIACMAETFHDSDLSDEALRAIADQDEDYEPDADDQATIDDLATSAPAACAPTG